MSGRKISHTPTSRAAAHGVAAAVPVVEIARPPTRAARWAPRPRNGCRRAPSCSIRCAPILSYSARWLPSRHQQVVDRAQHRAEAVGIGHPPFARRRRWPGSFTGAAAPSDPALEQPARRRRASVSPSGSPSRSKASAVSAPGTRARANGPPGPHGRRAARRDRHGGRPAGRRWRRGAGFTSRPRCRAHIREMVRSDENQPTSAMLRIAAGAPAGRSGPARVDLALRGGVAVEIGGDHEPVMVVEPAHQLGVAALDRPARTRPRRSRPPPACSSRDPSITARGS